MHLCCCQECGDWCQWSSSRGSVSLVHWYGRVRCPSWRTGPKLNGGRTKVSSNPPTQHPELKDQPCKKEAAWCARIENWLQRTVHLRQMFQPSMQDCRRTWTQDIGLVLVAEFVPPNHLMFYSLEASSLACGKLLERPNKVTLLHVLGIFLASFHSMGESEWLVLSLSYFPDLSHWKSSKASKQTKLKPVCDMGMLTRSLASLLGAWSY